MSRRRTRGRERIAWVGTAAGVLSLAGVGYYWYTRWSQSSKDAESSALDAKAASTSASLASSSRPRPSLSLHLPPSIQDDVSPEMLALCEQLSALYLLHLIHCAPDGSTVVEQQLQGILTLDTRRILAYSRHNGGVAIARALGCEAHLQVLTPTTSEKVTTEEMITSLQLISKNPTLKLLVLALVSVNPSAASTETLDLDSIVASLQEAKSNDTASHGAALRVIDLRSSKSWGTIGAQKMAEFRKAWR